MIVDEEDVVVSGFGGEAMTRRGDEQ